MGDVAVAQVTQGSCGCAIAGGIQGQVAWGCGKPDLAIGNPAHETRLEPSNPSHFMIH